MKKPIISICLVIALSNCASSNLENNSEDHLHSVRHYKSTEYGRSYLNVTTFSFKDKDQLLPAVYQINNIPFTDKEDRGNKVLPVVPGQFKIKALFIAKEPTELKVQVGKRDSVVINIYLKDSNEPLY